MSIPFSLADENRVITVFESATKPEVREKALAALNQLPPFSPTLNKLLATLAREDVFLAEISAIIEKDTILAGQVLKLVNSALYCRSGTVNSVGHAVAIMGLNKLRNLALSMSVTRMWTQAPALPTWSQAGFNLHSVATAIMADGLAQKLEMHYPEGAFTAGLLHAMGKMLLAFGLPAEYEATLDVCKDGTLAEPVEQQRIGCCHSDLAALALALWKLPVEIQIAVKHQHESLPLREGKRELATVLRLAHNLVQQLNIGYAACVVPAQPTIEAIFDDLGLGAQRERMLEEFQKEFEAIRSFF